MKSVSFDVVGQPTPQGSKVPIRTKSGQIVGSRESQGKKLTDWRTPIADAARLLARDGVLSGPVRIDAIFRFPMPKSRPQALRPLCYKTGAPDADKLARALGDALTAGGLIEDDARIVEWRIKKVEVWGSWTGAQIQVTQLDVVPATSSPQPLGGSESDATAVGVK